MKTKSFIRLSKAIAITAILLLSFSACKKDKDNNDDDRKKKSHVMFSGGQEVPANSSTGTGMGEVIFDSKTKTITYNFTWKLGDPAATTTNMHFHGAEDGSDTKSSPVVIGITGFATGSSGSISGETRVLTDVEVNQLLAGRWYLNVHSSTVPSGEIRGNIKF